MDQSSLSENKTLIRKLFEDEINHKDLDVFAGMVSSDYISHNDSVGPPADVKQTKSFLAAVFAAFPDTHVTIEDMVAEGDKVVGPQHMARDFSRSLDGRSTDWQRGNLDRNRDMADQEWKNNGAVGQHKLRRSNAENCFRAIA